jgi:putative PIN family toxin of toxin-antitoxin system
MTMRAVFDPNVLISAVLSRSGTPALLVSQWLHGAFELVVSPCLIDELVRVLAYPKIAARVAPPDAAAYVQLVTGRAITLVDPDGPPPVRSADPDDDYLIALAKSAPAVIVSGDSDLLSLSPRVPVFTPTGFLALINTHARGDVV